MSSLGKDLGIGFIGMLLQDGVEIVKFIEQPCELYLKVPEDSWAYHRREDNDALIRDANSYVKRIKEMLIETYKLPTDLRVFYNTYSSYYTREMGEANFKQHIAEYL